MRLSLSEFRTGSKKTPDDALICLLIELLEIGTEHYLQTGEHTMKPTKRAEEIILDLVKRKQPSQLELKILGLAYYLHGMHNLGEECLKRNETSDRSLVNRVLDWWLKIFEGRTNVEGKRSLERKNAEKSASVEKDNVERDLDEGIIVERGAILDEYQSSRALLVATVVQLQDTNPRLALSLVQGSNAYIMLLRKYLRQGIGLIDSSPELESPEEVHIYLALRLIYTSLNGDDLIYLAPFPALIPSAFHFLHCFGRITRIGQEVLLLALIATERWVDALKLQANLEDLVDCSRLDIRMNESIKQIRDKLTEVRQLSKVNKHEDARELLQEIFRLHLNTRTLHEVTLVETRVVYQEELELALDGEQPITMQALDEYPGLGVEEIILKKRGINLPHNLIHALQWSDRLMLGTRLWIEAAVLHRQAGLMVQAKTALDLALKINALDWRVYEEMAYLEQDKGNRGRAEQHMRMVIRLGGSRHEDKLGRLLLEHLYEDYYLDKLCNSELGKLESSNSESGKPNNSEVYKLSTIKYLLKDAKLENLSQAKLMTLENALTGKWNVSQLDEAWSRVFQE